MIVLADADLQVASSAAVWGSYTNCGQVCLSVERLFVEQTIDSAAAHPADAGFGRGRDRARRESFVRGQHAAGPGTELL